MLRNSPDSLRNSIIAGGQLSSSIVVGAATRSSWDELLADPAFDHRAAELRGRSVLLATIDQFAAAEALVQLDGIARRMVLCPPDLSREHLTFVADMAAADLIITDQPALESVDPRVRPIVLRGRGVQSPDVDRSSPIETEWILLTSGTTGLPKLVSHTLASLAGAIEPRHSSTASMVWSTFYDVRRFGGLQIFLRAALTGRSLVLSDARESTEDFLTRAAANRVTHISGTPSHWRRVLRGDSADRIAPAYVRLSGEIADQALLNRLQSQYPRAKIAHGFASTEAGLAFDVDDGLMGFPLETIGNTPHVEMKVEDQTLRVRSSRNASCYLGTDGQPLQDAEGFVDTGDVLELRDGRYYFMGRRDGTVNVGGLKVHPEEVEAVINRHPEVSMSLVRTKKSPITGALVVADVVLKAPPHSGGHAAQALQADILRFCRKELALHKVPVAINFVPTLTVAESGKLLRPHA